MIQKRTAFPAATVNRATLLIGGTINALLLCWARLPPLITPRILVTSLVLVMLWTVGNLFAYSVVSSARRWGDAMATTSVIAAPLLLGPVAGAVLLIGVYLLVGELLRQPKLRSSVNAASLGLAALGGGVLYQVLLSATADLPIPISQGLAVAGAASVFFLINVGTIAPVVSPLWGIGTPEFCLRHGRQLISEWGVMLAGGALAVVAASLSPEPRLVIAIVLFAPYALAVWLPDSTSPHESSS